MTTKKCVFKCNIDDQKIKNFNEDRFQKCQQILKIRQAYKLKYNNVTLPSTIDDIHGYHTSCYKVFMAMQKLYKDKYYGSMKSELENSYVEGESDEAVLLHGQAFVSLQSETSRDKDEKDESEEICASNVTHTCFFCNKMRKNRQKTFHLIKSSNGLLIERVSTNAKAVHDQEMLLKIENLGKNRAVYYHNSCKLSYFSKYTAASKSKWSYWHVTRNIHNTVYKELYSFIGENIIKLKQCYSLKFLVRYTKSALQTLFADKYDTFQSTIKISSLLPKIKKKFSKELQIIRMHNRKIIAPREGCIVTVKTFTEFEEAETLQYAALLLRKKFLSIKKNSSPSTVTTSNSINGECVIPEDILQFLRSFICENGPRTEEVCSCACKVDSIAQDLVYTIHHCLMVSS